MTAFTTRDSTPADLDWAYDVFKRVNMDVVTALAGTWPEPWQSDFFRGGFLSAPPRVIVVNGKDAGIFCLDEQPHALKIRHLHIDTPYQGMRIGTRILADALEIAHTLKKSLELEALAGNARAIALYRRCGFRVTGVLPPVGWVQEVAMRHKDTVAYAPRTEDGTAMPKPPIKKKGLSEARIAHVADDAFSYLREIRPDHVSYIVGPAQDGKWQSILELGEPAIELIWAIHMERLGRGTPPYGKEDTVARGLQRLFAEKAQELGYAFTERDVTLVDINHARATFEAHGETERAKKARALNAAPKGYRVATVALG